MKNRNLKFIEINIIERYFLIKKLLYFYKDSDVINFFGEIEKK